MSLDAHIAPNWTSAAGALEGALAALGTPLARHAIMGLTGHAWRACLGSRDGIVALASGPHDLDWEAMSRQYRRTGWRWERFGTQLSPQDDWAAPRAAAVAWAIAHLDHGRPLLGFDFHLHEHAVILGYDTSRGGFLVDDILSDSAGRFSPWDEWPSAIGVLELLAPIEPLEVDPVDAVGESLDWALACFAGQDGPPGQARGTAALVAWADALDGDTHVDRAGNAYMLAVTQAARLDGAAFLADVAEALPPLAAPLLTAERALRDEAMTLAPLLSLFPFPAGGHGNVEVPGLRRAAAMALRSAARFEERAAAAIREALATLG